MGRRRRHRHPSERGFWTTVYGGMPVWGIAAATVVILGLGLFALVASLQQPPQEASAAPADVTPDPVATRPPWIGAIFLGDSYFNGWGTVPRDRALAAQIAGELGIQAMYRGAGATGYVTARDPEKGSPAPSFLDSLKTWDGDLTRVSEAQFVLINGGLADRSADPATFEAGMREVIDLARRQQPTAQIIILGPPNITPMVESSGIDQRERAIAESMGVAYISFDDIMTADEIRPLISPDDLTHPVPDAVPVIAERIAQKLRELGVTDHNG
ncbi:SGNH/GDSL hydrolase family protein [Streptomyces albidoflavus]